MKKPEIAIIIPCYNEYKRLPIAEFKTFINSTEDALICFVNDASTDKTLTQLNALKEEFSNRIVVLSNPKNMGKAGSVRHGALHCHEHKLAPVLAYLDADLATSLEECYSYKSKLEGGVHFVFASRILKIGSLVERKFSRFLFGRIIATFISYLLDIKVYDTQCGCKVFKAELAETLFRDTFISKWLFDVEIFSRLLCHLGKENALKCMDEIPVKKWIDQGESKVKLSYFFRLWYDLFLIRRMHLKHYKKRWS